MIRACDLAEVPAWRRHRVGRDTRRARIFFGPTARLITRLARAEGLVLGRRVFLAPDAWELARAGSRRAVALLEHELVHVEQYQRMGWLGFLRRYLSDYLAGRFRGLSHRASYLSISLEREARTVTAERMAQATAPGGRRPA